ncbi:uncharacterized protein BHQ10_008968 [Talaromyces amestolkiae]|uniref:Major facilitator superfamily (MFS) profile domain-containing protein n=1 Tax=Talaromyces amestolkiae TaxID=1196081 RepID=A0A364LAW0_TALAM|nr:uncharacterized protein BHQ10_008968 [Talaromyces amestolkiae]RAO72956.1 hypothetical protein BHQ10_008968 [Talaromyces amestolkiae]
MATTKKDREYEIVLVGATGYTGKLTAHHIARNLPTNLKWAIAGRSNIKLDALAAELKHISRDRLQPGIEIVDVEDKAQLTALVARAKVCISVVSYNEVGANIIEGCIDSRTDYVDTAGSVTHLRQWIDKYHHAAEKVGVAIITSCGNFSAFQDLLTWLSANELAKTSSLKIKEVVLSVLSMPADPSGGTVKSMLTRTNLDEKTIQESQTPWYLSPVNGQQYVDDEANVFGIRHDAVLGTLSPSSFSDLQNRAVVHRTWGLLDGGNRYGLNFRYSEYSKVSSTIAGIVDILKAKGIRLMFTLAPLRAILRIILPKPGDGPDVEKEKNAVVDMEAVASADSEDSSTSPKVYARFKFSGGPYTATAAWLAQGAASLLYTRKLEDGVVGGCLTPAFLGADLVERIQAVGAELEIKLGGIVGSLSAGVLGEIFSRKYTMFIACCWVILGSSLYCGAHAGDPGLLYAGGFFTGLGVGLFSGVGPLYNAELASPELRGLLIPFYQFATILGMMSAFWIGYGSNNIGGTGDTQSNLAWQLPSIIQGIPACLLAIEIWWMPFSPRWLVKKGRVEEARKTLAWLRKLPVDDALVQVEFLEIQAEALFEPELAQYVNCVRTKDNFKRVATAWSVMFFQQWSGIDSIIYYASEVFVSLGLNTGTIALLATGVTGVVFFVCTFPAMLVIDKIGRKPMLLAGSGLMFAAMVIVGVIVAKFRHDWEHHAVAGWAAVGIFIWVYNGTFGATWGPVSWTLVSEIFPLSIRAKGASIGAFSNWINNFAIALFVPPMFDTWAWETKNATLEEMDRVFKSHTGKEDARMLAEAQRDVGLIRFLLDRNSDEKKLATEVVSEHLEGRS